MIYQRGGIKMRRNRGFSMVELIIVIAIMAILAAALAPALVRYIKKAQKSYDLDTARELGQNTTYLLAEEATYTSTSNPSGGGATMTPYESFYKNNTTEVTVSLNGSSYDLVIVCNSVSNGKGKLKISEESADAADFANALNEQIPTGFSIRCEKPADDGLVMASYIIGYPKDNPDSVEVWVGTDGTTPVHRLYTIESNSVYE